jgi:hypothetical protein
MQASEESKKRFGGLCVLFAEGLSLYCASLQNRYDCHPIANLPLPDECEDHSCVVAGALMLVLFGMVCDDEEGGGFDTLAKASRMFEGTKFPKSNEIRQSLMKLMDGMGLPDERHYWN